MAHYSPGQKPSVLMSSAAEEASALVNHFGPLLAGEDCETHIMLVYAGMSGVACATALALACFQQTGEQVEMAYVRKDGEYSHGSAVESEVEWNMRKGFDAARRYTLVFVDDFISSGKTAARCFEKAMATFKTYDTAYICQFNAGYTGLRVGSLQEMLSDEDSCRNSRTCLV